VSDEPRVPRLGPEDVSDGVREMFERFVRERGRIPNLFRVAAHRPAIAVTLAAHLDAVMGPGEVDVLLKEFLAIRVSHLNGCEY
jgi:alkylhydroperoxidase family enzyme